MFTESIDLLKIKLFLRSADALECKDVTAGLAGKSLYCTASEAGRLAGYTYM